MDLDARRAWQTVTRNDGLGFSFLELDAMTRFLQECKKKRTFTFQISCRGTEVGQNFYKDYWVNILWQPELDSSAGLSIQERLAQWHDNPETPASHQRKFKIKQLLNQTALSLVAPTYIPQGGDNIQIRLGFKK